MCFVTCDVASKGLLGVIDPLCQGRTPWGAREAGTQRGPWLPWGTDPRPLLWVWVVERCEGPGSRVAPAGQTASPWSWSPDAEKAASEGGVTWGARGELQG